MAVRRWGAESNITGAFNGYALTPAIAALRDGGFVAVWMELGGDPLGSVQLVRGQRFAADGSKVGAEFAVPAPGTFLLNPTVTGAADGGFVVAFDVRQSPTDTDPYFVRYDAAGAPAGANFLDAGVGVERFASFAQLTTGGLVAVWADTDLNEGDIRMQLFNSAGQPTSGFLTANSLSTDSIQDVPEVAALPGGRFVVAWLSLSGGAHVRAKIFEGTTQITNEIIVGQFGSGVSYDPSLLSVSATSTGGFAVAWAGSEVRARLYGPLGDPLTPVLFMNASSGQAAPDVVGTADGGFLVSWRDLATHEIRAQAFNAAGGREGAETVVNTRTGLTSVNTSTLLSDGRVALVWTNAAAGDTDVLLQLLDPRNGSVLGTAGADTLYGGEQEDEVLARAGNDLIAAQGGADVIYGMDGDDTAFGQNGDDVLYGGSGADTGNGGLGDDVLFGEDGADVLFGDLDDDQLVGGGGNDTLNGGYGFDGLQGGDGSDVLVGEAGNDALYGGLGDDVMIAGADDDVLVGDMGADQMLGDGGNDTAVGGAGVDQLYGGSGNDVLNGGADGDIIRGEDGDDVLVGEDGGDDLQGGLGSDTLFGDAGGDALSGGDGGDVLIGGAGGDLLTGGAGADIFWFKLSSDGVDVIPDFTSGVDRIWLTSAAFNLPLGGLNPANFVAAASPTSTVAAPTILYNLTTGALSYDPDGTGPQGALALAMMSGPLSASDFLIVA